MLDRKFLMGTTVIAGLAAMVVATAPTASFAQTAPAETEASDEEAEVEALVVTGSRIKRSDFTSAAPIQVITSEQSVLEGLVDTAEIIQSSSVASGSFQANSLLGGYVITGGINVNTISLRGLGAERTLVLVNGRRLPPSGSGGSVGPADLNVIPSTIIDRVEILKDGASSIYGSDAVAGVVNYITKTSTDGLELDVFGRVPAEQGGEVFQLAATWGKVFDRGYLSASASYYDQKGLRVKERDDTACAMDYYVNPVTGSRADFIDPATGKFKCYNAINNGWQAADVYGGIFQYDPALTGAPPGGYPAAALGLRPILPDWVRASRAGQPATFPYGDYSNDAYDNTHVISPIKRSSLYFTGGFDLTPTTEVYGELLFNRREDEVDSYRYIFETVERTNPNNTVGAGLVAGGLGASGRAIPLIILPSNFEQTVDYVRAVGGVRGSFGAGLLDGWDWDAYVMAGRSEATYAQDFTYQDRVYATTDSGVACTNTPFLGNKSGFSCASLPGGVPWFSPRVLAGDFNAAELAFLTGREEGKTTYDQVMFEGSISGELFDLPAGPIGAAAGVVYRKDKINDTPGANARSQNYWGFSTSGITAGDDTVSEAYAEFEIPIARGLPGIESLTANISGRYTDYESYGDGSTYKVGVNWQITPSWRFRATRGTSFRAPALFELFLAGQTGFTTSGDPCVNWGLSGNANVQANCAAEGIPDNYLGSGGTLMVSSGGGFGILEAETSEATTVGIVWTPSFIGLSVAVDYFDIEVNDQVARFGAGNILGGCYGAEAADFPNDYCTLIDRDPGTFDITLINNNYLNINSQANRGVDLSLRYEHEIDAGRFVFDSQFTWQLEDTVQLLTGSSNDFNGSTTESDFTGSTSLRFQSGDWIVNWGVDMIGKASDSELGNDFVSSTKYMLVLNKKQHTEFTAYHTLSVRKTWDDLSLLIGVNNLFDEGAPSQSAGQFRIGTAALNGYDLRGRRAFFNITKRW
jgi:iron complex outermembrane receptor protein